MLLIKHYKYLKIIIYYLLKFINQKLLLNALTYFYFFNFDKIISLLIKSIFI